MNLTLLPVPLICLALGVAGTIVFRYIHRRGERFYRTGERVANTLAEMAAVLQARQFDPLERFYSRDFRGQELGLTTPVMDEERDGVRASHFQPGTADQDWTTALAEWRAYLGSFAALEGVSLHLDHLQKWGSDREIVGNIRLEVIGTLRGNEGSGTDRLLFRAKFEKCGERFRIRETTLIEGERVVSSLPQFLDVAGQGGVAFRNRYYPDFLDRPLKFSMIRYGPGGITAVDYDNDGWYDLFIPDGVESKLFRNRRDGTFEDVTAAAGLAGLSGVSVAVFGDYDNDGYKDLFVSRTFAPNQLFHNNGDGTFTDVTAKSGIGADCCTTVAAWADYDNDGFLDLYVGRYIDPRKDLPTALYARNGEPNQLYHNNGDGTFANVTQKAGVGDTGLCLGVVWGDYDDDGYPDLFVANDFGRKTLYHNNGDGTFTDVTVKAGTLAYGAGMSASFVDYDNDGKFDLYVTHVRVHHTWFPEPVLLRKHILKSFTEGVWKTDLPLYWEVLRDSHHLHDAFRAMTEGNNLLRNRGDGTFEDVTKKAKVNPGGWFWGAVFADFDNDGWQDLYAANGWVYDRPNTELELQVMYDVLARQREYKRGTFFDPVYFGGKSWHGYERNRYLRNNGDGTFREIGRATGTDLLLNSRGVAVADFWNRGVLDIAIAASDDHHALLRNEIGVQRNWLEVELVGTRSNRDAIGARVTLRAGGKLQAREVIAGDSYASQSSLRQHFGLNQTQSVQELTVHWPASGIVQQFRDIAANRIIQITEGDDRLMEKYYVGGGSLEIPEPTAVPAGPA